MKFRRIKGDIETYRKRFSSEFHRPMGYYSMELIKLEKIVNNPIDSFDNINIILMNHIPLKRGSMNMEEIKVYEHVKMKLDIKKRVADIRNYNLTYLNSRQILLINPLVIKDIPKIIRPYLLSRDLFEVGWNLTEKYIYDQFVKHIKDNLPNLQRKYGQTS